MHTEWGELLPASAEQVCETRAAGGRIIAVGTTVARVLESAAAASAGLNQADSGLAAWQGETDLFIRPPYEFLAVDGLLTNFHFPRTTLLLLVQALGGTRLIRTAYEEAVRRSTGFTATAMRCWCCRGGVGVEG